MPLQLIDPKPETHLLREGNTLVAVPAVVAGPNGAEIEWHLEISYERVVGDNSERLVWSCAEHAFNWFWLGSGYPNFQAEQRCLRAEARARLAQPDAMRDMKQWARDWVTVNMTDGYPDDEGQPTLADLRIALDMVVTARFRDFIDGSETMPAALENVGDIVHRLITAGRRKADVQLACDIWNNTTGGGFHITVQVHGLPPDPAILEREAEEKLIVDLL